MTVQRSVEVPLYCFDEFLPCHSLLYLWEEDVKHLWHQMYSNIRYLRECVDETIAENQYAYLKNKLQAVLHKDTIPPVNNHIADIR